MATLAEKYRARAERVVPTASAFQRDMARELTRELTKATVEELYKRTPLKVTYKMLNSIGATRIGEYGEEAAFNVSNKAYAPYAALRLNMKGRSKLGGHIMDMDPAQLMNEPVFAYAKANGALAQKRIIR